MKKYPFLTSIIVSFFLIFAFSCSNVSEKNETAISIFLPGISSRSAIPETLSYYNVAIIFETEFKNINDEKLFEDIFLSTSSTQYKKNILANTSVEFLDVIEGNYIVVVKAFDEKNKCIARGSSSVTVIEEQTAVANIIMKKVGNNNTGTETTPTEPTGGEPTGGEPTGGDTPEPTETTITIENITTADMTNTELENKGYEGYYKIPSDCRVYNMYFTKTYSFTAGEDASAILISSENDSDKCHDVTINLYFSGTNYISGGNHSGLKFTDLGEKCVVNFYALEADTKITTTYRFGADSPLQIENCSTDLQFNAPGFTSGTVDSSSYTDFSEWISNARDTRKGYKSAALNLNKN